VISKLPTIAAVFAAALLLSATASAKTNRTQHTAPSVRQSPAPAPVGTFEARVEALMRQSGYDFRKVKTNSWYLILPGREMAQIRIILGAGPSSIAMGAVVVPKRNLRVNTDALVKLMKLSYDLNYVRVVIDADDDLIVMSQRKDAWLNVEEFKTTVSQVSAAADRVYAVMRPLLATP
jgi:hypothetical protein